MNRPDYCPIGGEPCQSLCDTPCGSGVAAPADPMDWPLPCDVTVGHGTMRKGVPLRTLVARMKVLYEMATGESADKVAGRTLERRQALFQSSALAAVAGHDAQPCRDCADFGPICPNSGRPCGTPAA